MTIEDVAAALVGARVGGIPLSEHEARVLAARVVSRARCRCNGGKTIKQQMDEVRAATRA